MTEQFVGPDGWPCEFEDSIVGIALIKAVRNIPGADDLKLSDVQDLARMLYITVAFGPDEYLPRNRPASLKTSKAELKKSIELSEKLERHLLSMRKRAFSALNQYIHLNDVIQTLGRLNYKSIVAYSDVEDVATPRGAPNKTTASMVTEQAADTFEHIAGREATYTTDPHTNKIRGAWPEFPATVFDALAVKASVEAQVRALREKSRRERTNKLP